MSAVRLNNKCNASNICCCVLVEVMEPDNNRLTNDHVYIFSIAPLSPLHFCRLLICSRLYFSNTRAKEPWVVVGLFCGGQKRPPPPPPIACNVSGIVIISSEMNPLEMLENENEPQTALISNPRGNLESLTTICAFENLAC